MYPPLQQHCFQLIALQFALCPSPNFRSFVFLVLSLSKFLFSGPKRRKTFAFWFRWMDICVLVEHFGGVALIISQNGLSLG